MKFFTPATLLLLAVCALPADAAERTIKGFPVQRGGNLWIGDTELSFSDGKDGVNGDRLKSFVFNQMGYGNGVELEGGLFAIGPNRYWLVRTRQTPRVIQVERLKKLPKGENR